MVNLSRSSLLLILALLTSMTYANDSRGLNVGPENECNVVKVVTNSENIDGTWRLYMYITNISNHELQCITDDLPWGMRKAILLVAIPLNGLDGAVEPTIPIEDPRYKVTKMRPGETLSGVINLENRFEELPALLKRGRVIIFWSFQLKMANNDIGMEQFSGYDKLWEAIPTRSGRQK